MPERDHHSIGEVLALLQADFPDITVSKIRFLESRGLIAPERTPSGYRKFYDHDVDLLRWVLTQQKVHFLPLKVIRERLEEDGFDPTAEGGQAATPDGAGEQAAATASDGEAATEQAPPVAASSPAAATRDPVFGPAERTVVLSLTELAGQTGLTVAEVRELERMGLLSSTVWGDEKVYEDEALGVATLAGRFKAHGVGPRHLRMYKVAAEREAGVYEQLLVPVLKRGGRGREAALAQLEELASLGEQMRVAMLRVALRGHLGS
jgi:DNA-binding transcriptional MerR regulator